MTRQIFLEDNCWIIPPVCFGEETGGFFVKCLRSEDEEIVDFGWKEVGWGGGNPVSVEQEVNKTEKVLITLIQDVLEKRREYIDFLIYFLL